MVFLTSSLQRPRANGFRDCEKQDYPDFSSEIRNFAKFFNVLVCIWHANHNGNFAVACNGNIKQLTSRSKHHASSPDVVVVDAAAANGFIIMTEFH